MKTNKLSIAAIASVCVWLVLLAAKPAQQDDFAGQIPFSVNDPVPAWAHWRLRVQSVPERVGYAMRRPVWRGAWVTLRQPDRTVVVHVGADDLAVVSEVVAP